MILTLIGPEETYQYDWPFDHDPPAVLFIAIPNKVWVRGANSFGNTHRYYEQSGWFPLKTTDIKRIDKAQEAQSTDHVATEV